MSRMRNSTTCRRWCALLTAAALWVGFAGAEALDLIVLRDGSEIRGRLLSVDLDRALIEEESGFQRSVPRRDLARIEFGEPEPAPALRVRVRVYEADDAVQLFLNDEPIAEPATLAREWFDLGPLLGEGSHRLRAEVINDSSVWAYRWVLEIEGQRHTFACGLERKSGCRENGATGLERGTMPAGAVWLYVDRREGRVDITRE
ncbi:MAG: hypothetical protein JSV80_14750 [Acidobacteriota bacterium]|nr:MAG: hypothetical protein JSV80_14750 [Acidobacteriota bacterium]